MAQSKQSSSKKEENKMEICRECNVAMRKTITSFKGFKFSAYRCPKCKEIVFTEKQAISMARLLDEEYSRRPISIGRSIGMTFPKDIVEAFDIDKDKRLKISLNSNRIMIEVVST